MSRHLPRRTFLRGLLAGAAVTVGLPALECMIPAAHAADSAFPKRFGLFFWGNGNLPDRWTPSGTGQGDSWSLSEQLAPLAPIKHKVTVVTGMEVRLPNQVPHASGAAGILSGAPLDRPQDHATFIAPTIDQLIAAEVGGATLYRSLETAVHSSTSGRSYIGPNSRNPPESSPFALYERLFGASFREPGEPLLDPTIGLRRSVLDAVTDQIGDLQARVGAQDRIRLEQHLDGIRGLELRLARLEEDPPDLAACERPLPPELSYPDLAGRPQLAEVNALMAELLAMALACDQTRVFSHWFSDPVNDLLFRDTTAGHHDLTHNEPGSQPQVHAITVQCVEAYTALLQALDAIPEGDGTLLDHCAILGVSEVSLGQTHSLQEMPILIGGSANGALRTDLHHRAVGGDNASKVLLTLMRVMGVNAASFGVEGAKTSDSLTAIEA